MSTDLDMCWKTRCVVARFCKRVDCQVECLRLCLRKQPVNVLANDFIALTGFFSETGTIDDVNAAVMAVDQPGLMQVTNHP